MARRHLSGSWSAKYQRQRSLTIGLAAAIVLLFVGSVQLCAQNAADTLPHLDIYGFAMLDTGYETGQSDPNWFDVMRPSKLPSVKEEFGKDGRYFSGVRQSHLGFKGYIPTSAGPIKTIFEFDMFGTGVDAGQTTIRLRHAWRELGKFGAGQTWSPFMDIDVFPNSVEYRGPNGMVFFRNVQVRYTPWSSVDSNFMVAIERPGGSGDQGIYGTPLAGLSSRFPAPDISAHYRLAGEKGHIQVAGIYRRLNWDDRNDRNATPILGFYWQHQRLGYQCQFQHQAREGCAGPAVRVRRGD